MRADMEQASEEEIDDLVTAEADDDLAWEEPIRVQPSAQTSFSISADLAARAAFLARVHHAEAVDSWLTKIIQERIEIEENAFGAAKRELAVKVGAH